MALLQQGRQECGTVHKLLRGTVVGALCHNIMSNKVWLNGGKEEPMRG
jgi:hypothetical protein